jgi:hypothetical protein
MQRIRKSRYESYRKKFEILLTLDSLNMANLIVSRFLCIINIQENKGNSMAGGIK